MKHPWKSDVDYPIPKVEQLNTFSIVMSMILTYLIDALSGEAKSE